METHTPKREPRPSTDGLACNSPMADTMLYPWNWSEEARNANLSPGSSCSSPEYREHVVMTTSGGCADAKSRTAAGECHRRGRPRADALTNLMIQGSTSPSSIKCSYCNRVFPREKSLQAHLRTHTGERPYLCDYPGCTKAFTQSGQLKTHQRLHTGEKPFLCTEPGCEMRFTHANRHCPDHPYATLTRSDDFVLKPVSENTELPHDVTRWLERYKMSREREERTPTEKSERKKSWKNSAENHKRMKSRKGLMMVAAGEQENLKRKPPSQRLYCGSNQDSQEESQDEDTAETCTILQMSEDEENPAAKTTLAPLRTSLDRLQPKKRWLREACMEQQLAKPLNWDTKSDVTSICRTQEKLKSLNEWNDCALNTNAQLDSSYRVPWWDMNLNKESPKVTVIKQENLYLQRQMEWDFPKYGQSSLLINLETGIDPLQPITEVSDCASHRLHWEGHQENKVSPTWNIKHYVQQQEIVSQDASSNPCVNENETRPTVLMLAGSSSNTSGKEITPLRSAAIDAEAMEAKVVVKQEDDVTKLPIQEDNKEWLGALALIELAKTQEELSEVNFKHDGS